MPAVPVVAWVGAAWLWASVKAIPAWWHDHVYSRPVRAAKELCLKKDRCDAYDEYAHTAAKLKPRYAPTQAESGSTPIIAPGGEN